jgi:hypothetical protein
MRMSRTVGSCIAALMAPQSLSIAGPGVPAGATMPIHDIASNPRTPASATVGTSGRTGERSLEPTAMARSVPSRTCAVSPAMKPHMAPT